MFRILLYILPILKLFGSTTSFQGISIANHNVARYVRIWSQTQSLALERNRDRLPQPTPYHPRIGFQHSCSVRNNQDVSTGVGERSGIWVSPEEFTRLADTLSISKETLNTQSVDATYYKAESDVLDEEENPYYLRLNLNTNPRIEESMHSIMRGGVPRDECNELNENLVAAGEALQTTFRWCDAFVAHLNLCPWAKHSLLSDNAIRIKIIDQSSGTRQFVRVLEEGIHELIALTDDGGPVDPDLGITFVVAIPSFQLGRTREDENFKVQWSEEEWDWEFEQFYDMALDLEEEADERVIIAPFHPAWKFYSHDGTYDLVDPLNFEKMSPFPIISIVNSDSIMKAGEDSTARIAAHNAKVLSQMGHSELTKKYSEVVWKQEI